MIPSAFDDKSKVPQVDDLAQVLGRANSLWNQLRERMAAAYEGVVEDWVFGGKKYGWSLRLKQKKRVVLYMTPCPRFCRASFAFGEKAAQAAQGSDLPAETLAVIDSAPRYAEGRAVRMEVRTRKEVEIVCRLAAIKMAN